MKIRLLHAEQIVVHGLDDLARMVPPGYSGRALGYGQGEGQFAVGDTCWGFYCAPSAHLQFEEGNLSAAELFSMLDAILEAIRRAWGADIEARIEGLHAPTFDESGWRT